MPPTPELEFEEQNTVEQMGTELERRIERLSAAVARLEEVASSSLPVDGAQSNEQLVRELAALRDENKALRSAHETVMGRLDMTIARLRDVLGG